ncbi:SusC/RagA family TonB-linked outer membrane protein [Bacteroides sp.]|uniref:SusC/RagA family TonB-linked outer membrane protein n=2 Tax=Bacteroides TaxID=816 RepID=UPI0023D39449|nr:SusC/RagA family TonB-linked outer membrane protein [Bacteroides sp.]MDE6217121.1 SusC/RagA family TonB-linked outer membrane protein [Bacteroides sp.]
MISFIGYRTQEVAVAPQVKVTLKPEAELLDEVMVVAYGTAKKSSFTGAASTVRGEKIQKMQVSDISKSLEGSIAGVQTVSSSGTPGSSSSIIIRGLGSISSSQSPLIVVDGVPYEGSLNSISTQDIESLTVLKDAAANSMYGARGSNGVIIITTKGSKSGKAQINFEARYGFNARGVGNYDIITDAGEYYEMMYEAIRNSLVPDLGYAGANVYASQHLIDGYLKYNKFKGVADNALIDPLTGKLNPAAKTYKWNDNWAEDPFENGTRQEYNVNISGGTEQTQAYASLGYLKDEGYMVGSGFDRISARVKVDQKIGKYFKVGGNIAYANTIMSKFGDTNSNYSNIFMFSQNIGPIYPIYLYDNEGNLMYDEKGNVRYDFNSPYAAPQNPLAVAKENINKTTNDNLSTRGYFEANFLKDFKFSLNVAYDVFNLNQTNFATPIGGDAENVGGRGYKYATRYGALNVNQLLNWNHSFGNHNVSALLGHETKNDHYNYMYGHMTNFADPSNPEFSNAAQYQGLSSYTSEYALEGYFVKGEYNYADRYYFTASYRRDGSSRFHKDNRWGSFWAIGGSWRLKEEAFLKDVKWLDNLKLKASFGTQGNDNVGYTHNYSDLYTVDRVDGEAAFTKVLRGNKDLTWEKSDNFNVGIEMGVLERITFNADFFIKETKDMLYASPLASSEGNPTYIYRNEMNMKNTGVEFELSADIIKNNRFKWNVALNATHYKNELTKLPASKPADEFPDGYQASSYWRKIGGSLYDWYTYEYVGVDPENGKPMYNKYVKDEDGNETIEIVNRTSDASLRQTGKSAIPDLTGGLSTTFEAFGFDLNIQTAFQVGGYVWDSFYTSLMNSGSRGQNMHKDMFNRWTPTNTNTNIPALGYDMQDQSASGDFALTKASYFSLRNLTVGYTLPTNMMKKVGINKLRVYLTGDNIWLKSKRKGLDPRQSFSGSTGYTYSALSTYSIGLNLSF